jgi:hypothetical protein
MGRVSSYFKIFAPSQRCSEKLKDRIPSTTIEPTDSDSLLGSGSNKKSKKSNNSCNIL